MLRCVSLAGLTARWMRRVEDTRQPSHDLMAKARDSDELASSYGPLFPFTDGIHFEDESGHETSSDASLTSDESDEDDENGPLTPFDNERFHADFSDFTNSFGKASPGAHYPQNVYGSERLANFICGGKYFILCIDKVYRTERVLILRCDVERELPRTPMDMNTHAYYVSVSPWRSLQASGRDRVVGWWPVRGLIVRPVRFRLLPVALVATPHSIRSANRLLMANTFSLDRDWARRGQDRTCWWLDAMRRCGRHAGPDRVCRSDGRHGLLSVEGPPHLMWRA
ncbi:hypothetical protein K488DRAFT_69980 [Vararia minispora EC-137]|uniref:Uncharacterized protein n=1 Tax=Vararia minispora EC-137 TaxID=1314806 RepID=A0ACB8QPF0_9AGAM|nr:hypothetical protein K488DRAFT_69980 [Vararia minispora EC-137]